LTNIVDLKGKTVEPEAEAPPPRDFELVLANGSVVAGTGYLMLAPEFVSIMDNDGAIKLLVPLSQLVSLAGK
jgi:hypothetical protein